MLRYVVALPLLAVAMPGAAQDDAALTNGFSGALRGCEEWVLNPASWSTGIEPFIATVGLGDQMGLVSSVADAQLPPVELQVANHFWRINSTPNAGYVLVVSDQLPMCHITGGGRADLQPVAEAVLASEEFRARWRKIEDSNHEDMISSRFVSVEDPAFEMTVSRSSSVGQRQDRVQLLATALYRLPE